MAVTRKNTKRGAWGANKPLEAWWGALAGGKCVVVIQKDGSSAKVALPKRFTASWKALFNKLDADPEIVAVLSSQPSQDAYEVYLYPKAKNKSVEFVVKNYKKYFKPMGPVPKDVRESGAPLMKKVRVPM